MFAIPVDPPPFRLAKVDQIIDYCSLLHQAQPHWEPSTRQIHATSATEFAYWGLSITVQVWNGTNLLLTAYSNPTAFSCLQHHMILPQPFISLLRSSRRSLKMTCTSCHRWERIAYDVMISPGNSWSVCDEAFTNLILEAVARCCKALPRKQLSSTFSLAPNKCRNKSEGGNYVSKRALGALGFQQRLSKACR
jgi:hypothetical protein